MPVLRIGPYRFTETDARRTIANLPNVYDGHVDRPELTGDLPADLEAAWAAMMAVHPRRRAAGLTPASVTGRVDGVHVSAGGVPKRPVDSIEVGFGGVVGDRQASRVHHGRPWQALCIWSGEVIDAFVAGGDRLTPGAAGENVTVRELPWADVRPGVRLGLGTVLCEVSAWALPCSKNSRWFHDGDHLRMHHERGPVSRVYATVLEPGRIASGDPAVLEP